VPLDTTNFHPQGPVKSVDMMQFYNLFTGVMTDQPVTFSNTLTLGGNQSVSTVPLRVYGAIGQNTNLIDLYADKNQAQPGFGFSAAGRFGWGPGGASPQDTFLSRLGTQNGHASDTPGLFITPALETSGYIQMDGSLYFKTSNATIQQGAAASQEVIIQTILNMGGSTGGTRLRDQRLDSSAGNIMLTASGNSHLGQNAWWDGAWHLYNTSGIGQLLYMGAGAGLLFATAPATAGTPAWTNRFTVDPSGNGSLTGSLTAASTITSTGGGLSIASIMHMAGSNWIEWDDTNTKIQVAARNMYFDTYNSYWYWRDTAASARSCMVLYNNGSDDSSHLLVATDGTIPRTTIYASGRGGTGWAGWNFTGNGAGGAGNPTYHSASICLNDNYAGGGNGGAVFFGCGGYILDGIRTNFTNGGGNGLGQLSFAVRRLTTDSVLTEQMVMDPNGNIYGGTGTQMYMTAFNPTSARRFKTDFKPLDDPLSIVLHPDLHAQRYTRLDPLREEIGFVADDWLPVVPEVVQFEDRVTNDDYGEVAALSYDNISAITFEALKRYVLDTNARLDALEARLAA